MAPQYWVRQGYRLYALSLLAWAGVSGLWLNNTLTVEPTTIGTGWLVIATFGALTTIAFVFNWANDDRKLFRTRTTKPQIDRFNNHSTGGIFLNTYIVILSVWSFATIEWLTLNIGILERTIVAAGWFTIALYGLLLTISLTRKHKDAVREAATNLTPSTNEPRKPEGGV